jgi:peptide/nickel transport system substrate-binding protein
MHDDNMDPPDTRLTRRHLLKNAGTGLVAVSGGATLLAACGSSGSASSSSATTGAAAQQSGMPVRGGTLTLGASGGSNNDALEAQNLETNTDYARGYALYEGLTTINPRGKVVNFLAESIEPSAKGAVWTIRVRPGVVAHNGKAFGARDVLFSLRRIVSQKLPAIAALGPIDLAGAKVLDHLTLRVPFHRPYSILPEQLSFNNAFMVPIGFDPKKNPIGTGPFKVQSFTPGQSSTFVRWDHYWQHGKPYLDKLVIQDIADETSQVNALQAGQVDAIDYLSSTSVAAVTGAGGQAIISKTGAWAPFTMRVDKSPFSDVRVRTALKLVIDRPEMNEQVFGGHGTVGNDVWGIYDPDFPTDLPQRQQDIEQAKSLLKAAGQSDLSFVLVTSTNSPGEVDAAQVFAAQAQQAGVQVKITQQDPTAYFANSYLKVPFSQDFFPYTPYLVDAGYATVTGAAYSSTKFNEPQYDKLYKTATRSTNAAVQREAIHEMAHIDYNQGGNIIPYFLPVIDGVSSKVKGIVPSVTGVALGNFNWANIWLES